MNFLIIDGNSIMNRAFYGVKLLTASDGHYTNAIFGFMNTLLHLQELCKPDCIAVAFDLKAPTFRHKMYADYKAGRRPMPTELYEQIQPLKDLLKYYGCHIVECEGYEADDILGTLAVNCGNENHAYIATGDRDSLQLIRDNVTVYLISTKMGITQTTEYTPEVLMKEYGLTPMQMIELKALQGDSSDKIPGVPGIGPKSATELIQKYGSIDAIFENPDALEVSPGVKNKLKAGKDSAYFSKTLGTIALNAPIDSDIGHYLVNPPDTQSLTLELSRHELFKLMDKLNITALQPKPKKNESAPLPFGAVRINADDSRYPFVKGEPLYFSVCFSDEVISSVTVLQKQTIYLLQGNSLELAQAFERLCSFAAPKYVFSGKEYDKLAKQLNTELTGVVFDIRLAAYLLNPNSADYSVEALCLSYRIENQAVLSENGLSEQEQELCKHLSVFPSLCNRLAAKLNECEQYGLLTDIEIPLSEVLADMELNGMAVNRNEIASYSVILQRKIEELTAHIYALAGHEFNINSPKQLGVVLFEEMGIPGKKKTKTGYSTNAEVLEELAEQYEIVAVILQYRTYAKLKSTYCDGLLKVIEADGRIRSTFNQTETRTGRLSSTEPNLQNIPVRTELGREFRKFFVAKEGYLLVDADYSQIELRVLASMADDKNMIAAFGQNTDIHTVTASKVFHVPLEQVTPELRSRSKAVNFGIIYGIGAFSLAKDIHTTRAQAEEFIRSYLSLYSGVEKYFDACIQNAKKDGYVVTLFKRRRYLPELSNSNRMLAAFGERVARNMPIQGTGADIIKIAMIRVHARLKREMPEVKLIMQVHDELILEAPIALAEKAAALLKEEMENAVQLAVKLKVDVGTGKTWYEAKD